MDARAFFETSEALSIIERSEKVAGVPVSLHAFQNEHEEEKIAGCGGCARACAHVATLPWGNQACRRSRENAGVSSMRRHRPVPFLCHMGFSCVAVAFRSQNGSGQAITFGPFCPAGAPDSLEQDAMDGLAALTHSAVEELPFEVSDIATASAVSIPEVAQWTAETLAALWQKYESQQNVDTPEHELVRGGSAGVRTALKRPTRTVRDPYQAADIAVALKCGDQARARSLVRGLIADTTSGKRISIRVKRARTVALVSAVLEAAERAGMKTQASWERFPDFERAARKAKNSADLGSAAMGVLGVLKRLAARAEDDGRAYPELNRIVTERIVGGVTLAQVAELMRQRPSTITRRLQRNFGMSFSEYTGRIRIDLSKDLLRRTKLKVGEAARRVGIKDVANFSKLFRRYEGMSPSEYRKRFGRKR